MCTAERCCRGTRRRLQGKGVLEDADAEEKKKDPGKDIVSKGCKGEM